MTKLAIVSSHPIQYYAPWFRHIAEHMAFDLRVFYLWDFGVKETHDRGFGESFEWDVPLLDGYDHEFVPNRSAAPGTSSFRGLDNPGLADRLAAWRPDAVLLMNYNSLTVARFMARRDRSVPLLFRGDSHRLVPPSGPKARIKAFGTSRFLKRMKACLYVGAANREYYRGHGVGEERLFFSPHAIDNDRFIGEEQAARRDAAQWRRDLEIPDSDLVVLFAGKFVPKKRPLDLLDAFLRIERNDCTLLFVGGGGLEGALKSRAAGIDRVRFAPFQNQSAMPRTYAACDLFVLPSFGPSETWGLAVNEAMCLAKPILASTHVGCAGDLVRDNGLVFDAGSIDDLEAKLKDALSSRERLERWGRRSREIVEDYSYEQASDGLGQAMEYSLAR